VAEGDTIHRAALRLDAALGGRTIELGEAPNPRSPIHGRAAELRGRTLERVEARGKHLIASFSGGAALHSHLGVNGRWQIRADGRAPSGRPWLLLASGRGVAAQFGGKLLRLVSESRVRNDPALIQLGPDPLGPDFDLEAAASRLVGAGNGRELGEALLDQAIVAGVGNAIRNEACFRARISPWRQIRDLAPGEAERAIAECRWIMQTSLATGRRPRSTYRAANRPCPRCGTTIQARGQGDANRMAYWCPGCQR
jgi:endonuclease VIII